LKKREYYTVVLLVLGCISLNLANWLPDNIYDDKIIYKYLGLVIFKGGVPYRDAFDNKPPLIFFLNALTWMTSYRIAWLIDTLLILLATILFYNLCRKKNLAWPWFFPLLFNLIIRNSLISYGNGMTREYTAVFLLIFFCVMFNKNTYKYFLLGGLAALTFWMQQDAIIVMMPMMIYTIFMQETAPKFIYSRVLLTAAGFAIISLPVILYFIYHHALWYLWQDTFLFNIRLPRQSTSFLGELKLIKHAIHDTEMDMVFYTTLIVGITALFLKSDKKRLLQVAFTTLLFSFSAEYLTARMQFGPGYMHYLLPLAASIPILLYVISSETEFDFFKNKKSRYILASILTVILILGALRNARRIVTKDTSPDLITGQEDLNFLKPGKLSDYQLYVFDDTYLICLYNQLGILSPSRWNYHFFGKSHYDWDKNPDLMNEIINDLNAHKTIYILDCSDSWNYSKNKLFYPRWKKFLQTNYLPVLKDSSNRMLWRIQ
jgi:hypothetical protein